MKNFFNWIKIVALIMLGVMIGVLIFSFIIAKTLWFPNVTVTQDGKAGVEMNAYSYSSWLWNKERITKINIFDRKNDGQNFEIMLNGLIGNLRLVHSGEDLAVISVQASEQTSNDRVYILHRVPKADGKESLEYKNISGNVLAVTPDEKSYFYVIPSIEHPVAIIRRDWEDNDLMKMDIPKGYELSLENPVFFSNQNKMAFSMYKFDDYRRDVDNSLIILDLLDNKTSIISVTKLFPDYLGGKLEVEDYGAGDLYITKENVNINRVKINE